MSRIKIQTPVVHTPSFREYKISLADLWEEYTLLGVEAPFPPSDNWYYFTDPAGWNKILPDLILKSDLYKEDKKDCDYYARKAYINCCDRYDLNTLLYTYGDTPMGRHGFNTLWTGDNFLIFEPNTFGLTNTEGYVPLKVLL